MKNSLIAVLHNIVATLEIDEVCGGVDAFGNLDGRTLDGMLAVVNNRTKLKVRTLNTLGVAEHKLFLYNAACFWNDLVVGLNLLSLESNGLSNERATFVNENRSYVESCFRIEISFRISNGNFSRNTVADKLKNLRVAVYHDILCHSHLLSP